MPPGAEAPDTIYVAIRASTIPGLFDLVRISDIGGQAEEAVSMLTMEEVELLSINFWPDKNFRERLLMLRRASPTGEAQWRAMRMLAGVVERSTRSRAK